MSFFVERSEILPAEKVIFLEIYFIHLWELVVCEKTAEDAARKVFIWSDNMDSVWKKWSEKNEPKISNRYFCLSVPKISFYSFQFFSPNVLCL